MLKGKIIISLIVLLELSSCSILRKDVLYIETSSLSNAKEIAEKVILRDSIDNFKKDQRIIKITEYYRDSNLLIFTCHKSLRKQLKNPISRLTYTKVYFYNPITFDEFRITGDTNNFNIDCSKYKDYDNICNLFQESIKDLIIDYMDSVEVSSMNNMREINKHAIFKLKIKIPR